jgi:hypothetical protein
VPLYLRFLFRVFKVGEGFMFEEYGVFEQPDEEFPPLGEDVPVHRFSMVRTLKVSEC